MSEFILVHDTIGVSKRKRPKGRPVLIRVSSIDSIRPYNTGRVRCVIGVNGAYLHVTETLGHLLVQMGGETRLGDIEFSGFGAS